MMTEQIAPGIYRLELPSETLPPFTHTNTYLIADGGVGVLIDPGFHEIESLGKIQEALRVAGVNLLKSVLLTHTHPDHIGGLSLVQEAFDIPIYVHPNELSRLEAQNVQALNAGRTLTVGNKTILSVFTPGHSSGHLSYYLEDEAVALIGDIAAGHGSTWIGIPEGDIDDYLTSIDTLRGLKVTALGPGHGQMISDPYSKLNEVRQHRLERLEQVYRALEPGQLHLSALRDAVYPGVHEDLKRMAEYSLLALLKKLMNDMRVLHLGEDETGPYAVRR